MTGVLVLVPGRVYNLAFSPDVTQYLEMVGLPVPEYRRVGHGYQFIFKVTEEQRQDMLEWADTVAAPWRHERHNPDARADAWVIDRWLKREGFTA